MSTQHTPGPWQVNHSDRFQVCDSSEQLGCSPIAYIARRERGLIREQDHANARLIAAAPDLFAALQDASVALKEAERLLHKVWAEHGLRVVDDGDGSWVDVSKAADRMDAAIDVAATAIARATGAQQ